MRAWNAFAVATLAAALGAPAGARAAETFDVSAYEKKPYEVKGYVEGRGEYDFAAVITRNFDERDHGAFLRVGVGELQRVFERGKAYHFAADLHEAFEPAGDMKPSVLHESEVA